jgi:NAD(P)H-hydrate epimerase
MNGVEAPVVALDVPSGVDADTGQTPGAVVRADATIAFGWAKLGTLIPPGRDHTGRLVAVEIGFPPQPATAFQQSIISPEWAHQTCPRRTSETHKYAAGSLLLVAGSPGMAGAAVMAARASQRAGLGLLRIASFPENRDVLQSTVPEAIFVDVTDADDLETAIARSGAIAIGPGLGTSKTAADVVEQVFMSESRAPTVLDADAITLAGSDRLDALTDWAHRRPLLLTPHTGELERISAHTRVAVAEDRVAVARAVAADLGVTLLLKGIPSVVAVPEGSVMVDVVGTSDLATGGMGDALTGAIGSFVAQGASLSDAASLGLYFTGRAAALAGKGAGLIPNDAIEALPRALGESGRGSTDLPFPFVHLDIRP